MEQQEMQSSSSISSIPVSPVSDQSCETDKETDSRPQMLTVETLWELLTTHQLGLEEAEMVGAVLQVVGQGPIHSQRD